VHRFQNGPVERNGHLYWPLDRLCLGAEEGLRFAAKLLLNGDRSIDSIGVDGWAVHYVRLDATAGRWMTLSVIATRAPKLPCPKSGRALRQTGSTSLRAYSSSASTACTNCTLTGAGWLNLPE
jgi:hypothetical protein